MAEALAFLAAFTVVWVPYLFLRYRRRPLDEWFGREDRLVEWEELWVTARSLLHRLGRRGASRGGRRTLEEDIKAAGEPFGLEAVAGAQVAGVAAGAVLAATLGGVVGSQGIGVGLIVIGLSWFGIPRLVGFLAKRRRAEIRRSVVDMADFLATVLRAGVPLIPAVERVASEFEGPIAEELEKAHAAMRAGVPASRAFLEMAERTGVEEFRQLVLAIVQALEWGTPVADVVQAQADAMRELRRSAAEEKGGKAMVWIMLGVVALMIPMILQVFLPNSGTLLSGFTPSQ